MHEVLSISQASDFSANIHKKTELQAKSTLLALQFGFYSFRRIINLPASTLQASAPGPKIPMLPNRHNAENHKFLIRDGRHKTT